LVPQNVSVNQVFPSPPRLRPAIDSVRRARRAGHFYTAGLEHSPTSSTGTGWEQTPLRARKLYVVVPKLTTDNSDDGVLMDDSVYPQMVRRSVEPRRND